MAALGFVAPAFAASTVSVPVTPTPRPATAADAPAGAAMKDAAPEPVDLSHALPENSLKSMPSSKEQLGALKEELAKTRPAVASAKAKSDALASEAELLRRKLIDTAAKIQTLEAQKASLQNDIAALQAQDDALAAGFANDRVAVTKLLAILERLQHDMPPALAVRPDDALAAARGSMLVGASLPPVYAQAASLARRIEKLRSTRAALVARQLDASRNAAALAKAQGELAVLSAQKDREAEGAASLYSGLAARMEKVAQQAADYATLVARVDALRRQAPGADASIVTVTAQSSGSTGLAKGSLFEPVSGTVVSAAPGDEKNPGRTYETLAGAQVIAPSDGKVLYAGPYHKQGQVLILEITTGYDIVLAGLGSVTVRLGDELLAGEPVGIMPAASSETRLYFELRQNGKGLDPEPWLTRDMRKAKKT